MTKEQIRFGTIFTYDYGKAHNEVYLIGKVGINRVNVKEYALTKSGDVIEGDLNMSTWYSKNQLLMDKFEYLGSINEYTNNFIQNILGNM